MALSFEFSKTIKRKLLTTPSAALGEKKRKDEEDDSNKIEFIQTIEANGATTKSKEEESNELVIPLIKNNRWYFPKDGSGPKKRPVQQKGDGTNDKNGEAGNAAVTNGVATDKEKDLEQQAVREILNDASDGGDKERVLNIPLLVQNRIPDGFETDDNLDVTLRAPEPTLDDYEKVPVEEFGLAMLRGMGWKKEEGIGLRNKAIVEMKEPELRPRGLGLGATRPNTDTSDTNNSNSNNKDNRNRSNRPASPPPSQKEFGLRVKSNKK